MAVTASAGTAIAACVLGRMEHQDSHKKGNEVERLFRRLKGFRRIFSNFEKFDFIFLAFINDCKATEA